MAETTGISWADHTFNPWIGCTKVSEACRNCYAERDNAFRKWNGGTWGPGAPRKVTSEANWRKPLQWNHKAILDGVRRRVFTASLADVFDSEAPADAQVRLFDLIEACAALDWLVLTKRPENALAFSRERAFPSNVWIGTSVENQKAADERIPFLLQIHATVRFLSMEPLLGPVNIGLLGTLPKDVFPRYTLMYERLHWVIAGGESGANARPSHPQWFIDLRNECAAADVPFHFKQWGEWAPLPSETAALEQIRPTTQVCLVKRNGTVIRPYALVDGPGAQMMRVGKKAAGRLIDGVEWSQFPEVANASR